MGQAPAPVHEIPAPAPLVAAPVAPSLLLPPSPTPVCTTLLTPMPSTTSATLATPATPTMLESSATPTLASPLWPLPPLLLRNKLPLSSFSPSNSSRAFVHQNSFDCQSEP